MADLSDTHSVTSDSPSGGGASGFQSSSSDNEDGWTGHLSQFVTPADYEDHLDLGATQINPAEVQRMEFVLTSTGRTVLRVYLRNERIYDCQEYNRLPLHGHRYDRENRFLTQTDGVFSVERNELWCQDRKISPDLLNVVKFVRKERHYPAAYVLVKKRLGYIVYDVVYDFVKNVFSWQKILTEVSDHRLFHYDPLTSVLHYTNGTHFVFRIGSEPRANRDQREFRGAYNYFPVEPIARDTVKVVHLEEGVDLYLDDAIRYEGIDYTTFRFYPPSESTPYFKQVLQTTETYQIVLVNLQDTLLPEEMHPRHRQTFHFKDQRFFEVLINGIAQPQTNVFVVEPGTVHEIRPVDHPDATEDSYQCWTVYEPAMYVDKFVQYFPDEAIHVSALE
jgi:hypothetical protein